MPAGGAARKRPVAAGGAAFGVAGGGSGHAAPAPRPPATPHPPRPPHVARTPLSPSRCAIELRCATRATHAHPAATPTVSAFCRPHAKRPLPSPRSESPKARAH
eukprot:1473241-Prymnesium_polylepis.1